MASLQITKAPPCPTRGLQLQSPNQIPYLFSPCQQAHHRALHITATNTSTPKQNHFNTIHSNQIMAVPISQNQTTKPPARDRTPSSACPSPRRCCPFRRCHTTALSLRHKSLLHSDHATAQLHRAPARSIYADTQNWKLSAMPSCSAGARRRCR
ncbi:hypothetical protein M0R45_015992 [Rubus argutus]|uniref:Uncharacterized protein n=1 Tax=Rubus argutus TaxID=59490 RepID=A0AAW1XRC6_RUBAR